MAFQWLQMRISEEKERRQREALVLERLPAALEELHANLAECIRAYREAFGAEVAEIRFQDGKIRVAVHDRKDDRWDQIAALEISLIFKPQGFRVEQAGKEPMLVEIGLILKPQGFRVEQAGKEPMLVEIGLLPAGRLFYRHNEQYLTAEEMTRRILDRALFPKLPE